MTQTADNYARVLADLHISEDVIAEALETYRITPELKAALSSPVVHQEDKHAVIQKVFGFNKEIQHFLSVLCDNSAIEYFEEIVAEYKLYKNRNSNILNATLLYVTPPNEEQLQAIKAHLCKECKTVDVDVTLKKDETLIGGFIIQAEGMEYDYSLRGRIQKLTQAIIGR